MVRSRILDNRICYFDRLIVVQLLHLLHFTWGLFFETCPLAIAWLFVPQCLGHFLAGLRDIAEQINGGALDCINFIDKGCYRKIKAKARCLLEVTPHAPDNSANAALSNFAQMWTMKNMHITACFPPVTVISYVLRMSMLVSFTKHIYWPWWAVLMGEMERSQPSFLILTEPDASVLISLPIF